MIKPIPHADEADIAEETRPVDDGIDECDTVPDQLGENQDADAADLLDQKLSVWVKMTMTRRLPAALWRRWSPVVSSGRPGSPIRSRHNGRSSTRWHRATSHTGRTGENRMTVASSYAAIPQAVRPGGFCEWRQLAPVRRPWVLHNWRPDP